MEGAAAETGPVQLASDSSLPTACQTYIAAVQACIGRLQGQPNGGTLEKQLRTRLQRDRDMWPRLNADSYRAQGCEQRLQAMRANSALPCS